MRLTLLSLLVFTLFSCTELTTVTPESPDVPETSPQVFNDNPIMYCGLAVGQKSAYVMLEGRQYFNNTVNDDFNYLNDTLIVEIIGEDDNGFLVEEYFTENSEPLPMNYYSYQDSTYQYYLKIENDSLHFYHPESEYIIFSHLFWHMDGKIDLSEFDNQEVEILGWKTSLSYCECDQKGFVTDYEQFGTTYDLLNVFIHNSDMQFDGPGTTYIYSNLHGMVRTSHYGWWTQSGFGWDLLANE